MERRETFQNPQLGTGQIPYIAFRLHANPIALLMAWSRQSAGRSGSFVAADQRRKKLGNLGLILAVKNFCARLANANAKEAVVRGAEHIMFDLVSTSLAASEPQNDRASRCHVYYLHAQQCT